MKKLRPLLAAALLLAAASPRASLVTTISVTTSVDEDGTNSAACSLREAVKTVNQMAPYGGCAAPDAFTDNVIQLEAVRYALTRGEIFLEGEIIIYGKDSQAEAREDEVDPLTGKAPRRVRPDFVGGTGIGATGTRIVAAPGSRIFNSSANTSLKDLVLHGSGSPEQTSATTIAGNGGVIFSGASLSLDNVIISGGRATGGGLAAGNGGAIYLGGSATTLTLTDVTLEGSQASNKGGAIAMLCQADLTPYAGHTLTLTRVLLRDNSATLGAGAIDVCGNSGMTLTASTLSANTSAAGAGAITYVQGADVDLGQLLISNVTAAEQVGHVLALNGIANVQLTGSLLSGFDTPGRSSICHNPDAAVPWSANSSPSGRFNAVDDDGSCDSLLKSDGSNVDVVPGTSLADVLVPIQRRVDYYPAVAGGAPFGLTDYYLPKVAVSSPILDKGEEFANCLTTDQRNLDRRSGARCDIGAVERLVVTARDDKESSRPRTDRLAIVDVLANDSFGEHDTLGPYTFAANEPDDAALPGDQSTPSVILVDDAAGRCQWKASNHPDYAGMLVVSNDGVVTTEDTPVVCTYRVVDSQPATSSISSMVATVKVQFRNLSPLGTEDSYLRPVGTSSITFNPLENDTDEGDGKYGLVRREAPDPVDPINNPPVVTYGPEVAWAPFYPIEIDRAPQLGEIVGASTGLCPGSASIPRICLNPPLRYVAKNSQSPFTDSFTYRVYDAEGLGSNSTTVTIYTDAPDPDHGGGGSLDLLGGLLLALLGLRRFLRL